MMKTISLKAEIPEDRELRIALPADVPVGPAEVVLVVSTPSADSARTLGDFAESEFIGMWRDRSDIVDSSDFARALRDGSWKRSV